LMGRRRDPQSLRVARGSGKHRGRAWVWTCLLAAAIIATVTVLRVREGRIAIAPAPHVVTAPAHPAFAMSLVEAYDQAAKLVGPLRPLETLPYFQRMIAGLPEDDWALRHDYANALQGASVEGRTVLGLLVPAARSSFERVDFMRRAMTELDRAQRIAPDPRAAATVHLARARQLGTWGLPWNACVEARAAAATDRTWAKAAETARQWARRISGPGFSALPDADR